MHFPAETLSPADACRRKKGIIKPETDPTSVSGCVIHDKKKDSFQLPQHQPASFWSGFLKSFRGFVHIEASISAC